MVKGIFVTGIDTEIGKTYVTARIVKQLKDQGINVAYYKAALSGAEVIDHKLIPGDLEVVRQFASLEKQDCQVSYVYKDAYAPHLAAKIVDRPIDLAVIEHDIKQLQDSHDMVVIEGSGGIICPLGENIILSDVMKLADYPLVIVTPSGLGSINGCVLTCDYAKNQGLSIAGMIMNNYEATNILHQDNRKMIERLSGYCVLGYLGKDGNEIKMF